LGPKRPQCLVFARILIAKPVPAFAEYARFPARSAGFQPSYNRRIRRRNDVSTQVPARTEEFAENRADPLFAGYFRLNVIASAPK
jgi:hypothetical protein